MSKPSECLAYLVRLNELTIIFEEGLEELADRMWHEVILPVCKKHSLEYTNDYEGKFYFFDINNRIPYRNNNELEKYKYNKTLYKALTPILSTLNRKVYKGVLFGSYVAEVGQEDYM